MQPTSEAHNIHLYLIHKMQHTENMQLIQNQHRLVKEGAEMNKLASSKMRKLKS